MRSSVQTWRLLLEHVNGEQEHSLVGRLIESLTANHIQCTNHLHITYRGYRIAALLPKRQPQGILVLKYIIIQASVLPPYHLDISVELSLSPETCPETRVGYEPC